MPKVTVTEVVPVPLDAIYRVLSDMQQFPRFMKNVDEIQILERGDSWTVSQWITRLQGAKFRWIERDTFFPEQGRITFVQTEGDLKTFQGEWRLTERPEGTEVTLDTEFEFGIPMLASLLNPVAKLAIRENAREMVRAIGSTAKNANREGKA